MHQISTDTTMCKNLQILNNFNVSYAEDLVQSCCEMTKVGLTEESLDSEIKSQEIKTIN